MDFFDSYHYLLDHPLFCGHFSECLYVEVVKVNPETESIDDDENKNTETRVWLEAGKYSAFIPWHDIDLDCGAETFEKAICELAVLVKNKYGDNYVWEDN